MLNVGGWEMVVIGATALIVVGPAELPNLFRKVGQLTGRLRGMADEFRRSMEEAAEQAGAKDLKREFNNLGRDTQEISRELTSVNNNNKSDYKAVNDIDEVDLELGSSESISGAKASGSKKTSAKKVSSKNTAPKNSDPQNLGPKAPSKSKKTPTKES